VISRLAGEAGLPVELWVRIAVEAGRLVSEISSLSGRSEAKVASVLTFAAAERDGGVDSITAGALRRYASELEKPQPGKGVGAEIALRLPEEMTGAWSRAASRARISLADWVAARLTHPPANCVAWETAAAAACQSLGEWTYASWLRASANARA
jgi:predicted HicB family RNase H-like nuclease